MKISGEIQKNCLIVGIDWLSFTVKDSNDPWQVVERLGMDLASFRIMNHGAYGYKAMLRHKCESVSVLYDGNDGMGVHVDITGSSIAYVLNSFKESKRCVTPFGVGYDLPIEYPEKLMCLYLQYIRNFADITRIDACVDDFTTNYFTVSDVQKFIDEQRLVTPFRKSRYESEKNIKTGMKTGETLYLGSRKSEVFLRIYDKALEQKVDMPWIRWELEIKGDKANLFADDLCKHECLGSVIIGVLARYVRFINLDDSNRSRCSIDEKWAAFINGINALRLTVPKKEFSVERSENYFIKYQMPTLAGLIFAHGGDFTWVADTLEVQFNRLPMDKQEAFIRCFEGILNE